MESNPAVCIKLKLESATDRFTSFFYLEEGKRVFPHYFFIIPLTKCSVLKVIKVLFM